jgi:FkbM family methyltransferase
MGYLVKFFDYIQLLTLFEEIFVFEVYRFSTQNPRSVVVDCGSNIGLSILYIKTICSTAKVIAFEPDHETFALLRENILTNNLNDVTCHNLALSNFVGEAVLFKPNISGSPGMSLIPTEHANRDTVYVACLSHFINEQIDFLKIDVEGSEIQILNDLIETDKIRLIRQMVIEFHPAKFSDDIQELLHILEPNHFTRLARHTATDKASDKIYYFKRMN